MNKTYILAGLLICVCLFFIYSFGDNSKNSLSNPRDLSSSETYDITTTKDTFDSCTISFSLYVSDTSANIYDVSLVSITDSTTDPSTRVYDVIFNQQNGLIIGVTDETYNTSYFIPKNQWISIGLIYNKGLSEIYVDGKLAKTSYSSLPGNLSVGTSPQLSIGNASNTASRYYISNFDFFDKALNPTDLARISKDFHNKYNNVIKPDYGASIILRKDGEEISKLKI